MIPRWLPAFSVAFAIAYAVIYFLAVQQNWALFTYHPALGTFGVLTTPAQGGPSMYWYGWMATSALGGAAVAALAAALPPAMTRWLSPWLSWAVPLCAMLAFVFLLRAYFLR